VAHPYDSEFLEVNHSDVQLSAISSSNRIFFF